MRAAVAGFLEAIGPAGCLALLLAITTLVAYGLQPLPGGGIRAGAWWRALRARFARPRRGGVMPTDLPPLHQNCRCIVTPLVPFHVEHGQPLPPLPDHMLTWPGKEQGEPRPPILWLGPVTWPTCPKCEAWLVELPGFMGGGDWPEIRCPACGYIEMDVAAALWRMRRASATTPRGPEA